MKAKVIASGGVATCIVSGYLAHEMLLASWIMSFVGGMIIAYALKEANRG